MSMAPPNCSRSSTVDRTGRHAVRQRWQRHVGKLRLTTDHEHIGGWHCQTNGITSSSAGGGRARNESREQNPLVRSGASTRHLRWSLASASPRRRIRSVTSWQQWVIRATSPSKPSIGALAGAYQRSAERTCSSLIALYRTTIMSAALVTITSSSEAVRLRMPSASGSPGSSGKIPDSGRPICTLRVVPVAWTRAPLAATMVSSDGATTNRGGCDASNTA